MEGGGEGGGGRGGVGKGMKGAGGGADDGLCMAGTDEPKAYEGYG